MDDLIDFVNKIREFSHSSNVKMKLDLPQIVVLGEQSSGKSSVLDGVVGRELLPKGSGIVTRRPVVIQLCPISTEQEYATFAHSPGAVFYSNDDIMREIQLETVRSIGYNRNVSPIPIILKFYSPRVLSLTLIDLPGLTKVPVDDQPENMPDQLLNIAVEYCKNPKTIMMVVLPAVSDITNSDSLNLARHFDPELTRTVGVLTKLDMMEEGTDALGILENKVVKLSKGWVGVVNRGQRDLDGNTSIREYLEKENLFFSTHPKYRRISHKCGIKHLRFLLHNTLKEHIRANLPKLKDHIKLSLSECKSKISEIKAKSRYSQDVENGEDVKFVLNVIHEFQEKIKANLGISQETVDLNSLTVGASMTCIFRDTFLMEFAKTNWFVDIEEKIRIGIENASAIPGCIQVPDSVMKSICRTVIESMRPCALKVIDMVTAYINQCILESINKELYFPALNDLLVQFTTTKLNVFLQETIIAINFLIDVEKNHINFRHPDFVNSEGSYSSSNGRSKCFVEIDNKKFKSKGKRVFIILNKLRLLLFKDIFEKEMIGEVNVIECKLRTYENKPYFSLYPGDANKKYVMKEHKHLDIRFDHRDTMELWRQKLAHMIGTKDIIENTINDRSSLNIAYSQLPDTIHITKIKQYVERYIKVILKHTHDYIIKICHHNIINQLLSYTRYELSLNIIHNQNLTKVLEIDPDTRNELHSLHKREAKLTQFVDHFSRFNIK